MKVVKLSSLRSGRHYTPGNIPGTHFCYRLFRPQGHIAAGRIVNKKIPITPSGIEPATFRIVAHCLNHMRDSVRRYKRVVSLILGKIAIILEEVTLNLRT